MITIQITGIKEALKAVKRFANPYRKQLIRKALSNAAKYLRELARLYVGGNSGILRKSLTIKSKYYARTDTMVVMMGPKTWYMGTWGGRKRIAHKYAHLREGGRRATKSKTGKLMPMFGKNGRMYFAKSAKAVGPHPFISKASRVGQSAALNIIRQTIAAGIVRK